MSNKDNYIGRMWAYAKQAEAGTGIPAEVIVIQWGHETGWGTSDLVKRANNHGGIKANSRGRDFVSGMYAGYNNTGNFVKDYIRVMNLSYYDKVRAADSIDDTIRELDASPYAEDENYGNLLRSSIRTAKFPTGTVNVGSGGGFDVGSLLDSTKNMSGDELKKYAALGFAVIAIGKLLD